eukprot:gnl/Dysnectes_brevis/1164_a1298_5058.p1 GENE.gnl/Dysnectes_brevis/1164_a1298_5058~~gnl/Dysnectes_brevis/1164_a1298_5058.p1  ORF type:complete len:191 (+),score=35.77 gnl/Dysnectes_brevis/1164_a1298_5058:55-627(+)
MSANWILTFHDWVEQITPYAFSYTGIYSVLAFSIIGSGWGIYNTGVTLLGSTINHPEVKSKNLLSILFCEAIAIYGLIMSIIIMNMVPENVEGAMPPSCLGTAVCSEEITRGQWNASFGLFAAGTGVGLTNLVAGVTVGIIGSAVCATHVDNASLFVKIFISEIFAEAISLIGLIGGIIIATGVQYTSGQ